jgi:hypothetical protein
MDFHCELLASVEDVPPPPGPEDLRISGFSLVFYVAHRFAPEMTAEFAAGKLKELSDDRSYKAKVRDGSGLRYSAFIDAGEVPAAVVGLLGSSHATRLSQSILTFSDEYALSAIPFQISVPTSGEDPGIHLSSSVSIDRILRLIALLGDPNNARALADQAALALTQELGITADKIVRTWSIPGSLGMQVWNLDGTPDRPSEQRYAGVTESAKYSWEISALLSYSADHMQEEGLWRRRAPLHVFNYAREGAAFFDDHMIFVNSDCCLEIGHLPAWTRGRSAYRLKQYGFDSSSIYVWTVGILRSAIISDLAQRYEEMVSDLSSRERVGAGDHADLTRRRIRHEALLARAVNFKDWLVEARNRALADDAFVDRPDSRLSRAVHESMSKVDLLSQNLLRVAEDRDRSRREFLLATLGIVLAAVQVPPFIDQVHTWFLDRQWLLLISSSIIIALAMLATIAVVHRRKNVD